MKIFYSLDSYGSVERAGRSYCDLIQNDIAQSGRHHLAPSVETADVVILHRLPLDFGNIYRLFPVLRSKYVIAPCTWETDELPDCYKRSIEHVQEIWAPSHYSQKAFQKHHPRVLCLPHVIDRDMGCGAHERKRVRERIGYSRENMYYLMITKLWDTRKNAKAVIRAFEEQRSAMPRARLIIKASPQDQLAASSDNRIVTICDELSWQEINALYEYSDVYVSAHHSEGWGWTLSDALLFGKPTIATGYSGNMEFMNRDNSILLDFIEDYIHPEDTWGNFFTRKMRWAYPIETDLAKKMVESYRCWSKVAAWQKCQAPPDLERFRGAAVARRLESRFDQLEHGELNPPHTDSPSHKCYPDLFTRTEAF